MKKGIKMCPHYTGIKGEECDKVDIFGNDPCPDNTNRDCEIKEEKYMENKHTPGPWKWTKLGLVGKGEGKNGTGRFIVYAYGISACCNTSSDEELIAAAPDLLDALEFAIKVIKENNISGCQSLEAVVKKARGEL